jgi:ribonuclease PH
MLPRAGGARSPRESVTGKIGGRTHEIQRLIGRSLRGVTDLKRLGERTILLDCDVIQADGGTRTAAITGAWVALHRACTALVQGRMVRAHAVRTGLAAVSVGIVGGTPMLDLAYVEDAHADVDSNVVMTDTGTFVEVQATAERVPFARTELDALLALAEKGIRELFAVQQAHLR